MELFWTKGYEATSLSDLTAELGIHPGSLYRTFGDKHALFLRALKRYHETRATPMALLASSTAPMAVMRAEALEIRLPSPSPV